MSRPFRRLLWLLLVLMLLITAVGWCMTHEKVVVCITNSTQQPLENAQIEIVGGGTKQYIAILSFQPGQKRCVQLQAHGESDAALIFRDKQGAVHRQMVVGYFEPGYRIKTLVTIGPDLAVSSQESNTPTCFF